LEKTDDKILDENKSFFREWLEKLQQESWQLELIISGFALYGIFNSRDFVQDFEHYIDSKDIDGVVFNNLDILLTIGWRIFFINLLVHVILRSLWIGAIGLRYVSGEIEYEKLNYSKEFTDYLRRKVGDYDDFIERLERICSVLFSYTFLLFLLFLSLIMFGIVAVLPAVILEWFEFDSKVIIFVEMFYAMILLLLASVVFIDFVSLGGLKRIKDSSVFKYYGPIYRFFSIITLSFLYRPLLYNFLDEKYTRRLFFFSLPYIFLIAAGNKMFNKSPTPHLPLINESLEQGVMISENYYEDLYFNRYGSENSSFAHKELSNLRLLNYKIRDNYLSLFINSGSGDRAILENVHGIVPKIEPGYRFELFGNSDPPEDPEREKFAANYNAQIDSLDNRLSVLRDSIKLFELDDPQRKFLDSIRVKTRRKKNEMAFRKSDFLLEYEREKNLKILNTIKDLLTVYVDDKLYDDKMTCHYYWNTLTSQKGLLCDIDVQDLSRGHHKIRIDREYYYNDDLDTVRSFTRILPFLKLE